MKPASQYLIDGKHSNCFSACVASLLEIEAEAVPDFMWTDDRQLNPNWYEDFATWLKPFGYAPLMLTMNGDPLPLRDCYYIVSGKSVRGIMHAVVGMNNEIVHDPYPSRAGITEIVDYVVFVRTFV